jgi:hypothetical protein
MGSHSWAINGQQSLLVGEPVGEHSLDPQADDLL